MYGTSIMLSLIRLLSYKTLKYEMLTNVYIAIPQALLANDKYYGSKLNICGARSKIIGSNK